MIELFLQMSRAIFVFVPFVEQTKNIKNEKKKIKKRLFENEVGHPYVTKHQLYVTNFRLGATALISGRWGRAFFGGVLL